jgi:hypothetical protein
LRTPACWLGLATVVLYFSVAALAEDRQWRDATVTKITAETTDGGVAVLPVGGGLVGVPIKLHKVFYHVETEDVTYVLAWVNKKNPLNVTLQGKTKIALDKNGRDAHILDDAGKDVKLPISLKIAKPKQEAPKNPASNESLPD